jgi:hypothetical protein
MVETLYQRAVKETETFVATVVRGRSELIDEGDREADRMETPRTAMNTRAKERNVNTGNEGSRITLARSRIVAPRFKRSQITSSVAQQFTDVTGKNIRPVTARSLKASRELEWKRA